jgi:hypothetical protein
MGNVGQIQVALPVKARSFKKTVSHMAWLIGIGPLATDCFAQAIRHPREHLGFYDFGWGKA